MVTPRVLRERHVNTHTKLPGLESVRRTAGMAAAAKFVDVVGFFVQNDVL